MTRHSTFRLALAACSMGILAFAPARAHADAGALTLELGGLGLLTSLRPPLGQGERLGGTEYGGALGARFALTNSFELTFLGHFQAPAMFFHEGVAITSGGVPLHGTLQSSQLSWGGSVGAQYVRGLVWRFHAGLEVGWTHRAVSSIDYIDVSDPSNPRSFGLALEDQSLDNITGAAVVGLEWCFSDHMNLMVAPRLRTVLGTGGGLEVLVPVTIGYSWYLY